MSDLITQTDEEAYADFAKRYGPARSDYDLARILSGRLRDLDKRTRAANKRADALERENAELREKCSKEHAQFLEIGNMYLNAKFEAATATAALRDAKERKE